MQSGDVTTPFGRRSMTLAQVKGQVAVAAAATTGGAVDKWKVFRDVAQARATLNLSDRALAVLNALLSFHPAAELEEGRGPVVFPSNAQLSLRAHGMAGTTLRRHLAALVEAGLIIRRDSPNGKRYARKDEAGAVESAFGFSLAPLRTRAAELAARAATVAAARQEERLARERLSLLRRDVRKLISAAQGEGAAGDWTGHEAELVATLAALPRAAGTTEMTRTADRLDGLRARILNTLEMQGFSEKTDGNADENGRHIQNSNTDSSLDSEHASKKGEEAPVRQDGEPLAMPVLPPADLERKSLPLGLVLKACPDVAMYGPGGAVENWRDLLAAAAVVRSTLGVSPSAYEAARAAMGAEGAAVTIACILAQAGRIQSAGGYLRHLTRRAECGEFSPMPMLMALLNAGQRTERAADVGRQKAASG
ncbi:plasmid replication protein RepC [Ensifer soli]|uniref:plasmid replication protein RepC n=1 Tax=Ciceribacter sp. sgz301302 TaxID=3342379 RepID=UPI0035B9B451